MCIGYDPFKWADIYESEEEYFEELLKEQNQEIEVNDDNRL